MSAFGYCPIIFIDMAKKKTEEIQENVPYILPSNNEELKEFVSRNKVDVMEQVVGSIEHALKHGMASVEVFQFKNTPFVVTVSEPEFGTNIDNIYKYYVQDEIYELCPRIIRLQELLKRNINEK